MAGRTDGGKERWWEGERATALELSPQAEWEAKIQDSGTAQRVVEKIKLTMSMKANQSSSRCHSVTYRAPQKHRLWLAPLPCSTSNGVEKARQQAFNKSWNSSEEASAISLTWDTKLLAKLQMHQFMPNLPVAHVSSMSLRSFCGQIKETMPLI